MEYNELKTALGEWVDKVLRTMENTNGWVDKDTMESDVLEILERAFG